MFNLKGDSFFVNRLLVSINIIYHIFKQVCFIVPFKSKFLSWLRLVIFCLKLLALKQSVLGLNHVIL